MVLRAARHLLELINEVLDLARVETGRLSVSPEPVALLRTVSGAIDLIMPLAAERGSRPACDAAGLAADQHVSADSNRLNQVLLNLLSNAIKYNRDGGRVDISFPEAARRPRSDPDQRHRCRHRRGSAASGCLSRSSGSEPSTPRSKEPGSVWRSPRHSSRRWAERSRSRRPPSVGSSFILGLLAAERPGAESHEAPTARRPWRTGLLTRRESRPRAPTAGSSTSRTTSPTSRSCSRSSSRYFSVELISAIQGRLGLDLARKHRPGSDHPRPEPTRHSGARGSGAAEGRAGDRSDSRGRAQCRRQPRHHPAGSRRSGRASI